MKKLLSIILAVILIFALVPYSVLAESIIAAETESAKLRLLHTVWEELDTVEAEMLSSGADQTETVMAVYKAAVQNPDVDANSFSEISESRFTFTVSGMHCLYDYEANRQFDSEPDASIEPVVVIPGKKGGPTDLNVLVIGPQYGHDSNFTSFYQDKAQSIADVTGGSVTVLQSYGATGPAIAAACQNAGIILIDAFGSNIDGYSYLYLMTDDGITSSDFSQGWAVSSGTYTCIDARYIKYHITSQLPNSIVWWSAGPCMASDVGGRTGSTLLNAGAGCVFGYSNSVTYSGDMYITRTFWNDMIDESTVAEAFAHTVAVNCPNGYAPNGLTIKAYPVVMSPVDPFPSNPDSPQTVYCDQTLFGGFESVDLEDCYLDTESIEIYRTYQAEIAFVRVPDNAYHYELAWGSEDESIAVISGKKRKAVITGVGEGSTRVYCDVSVDGTVIGRKYCSVNVLYFPNVNEAVNVEGGDLLFESPTESYPWTTAVVDGRFAVRSGNKGVGSTTSTLRLVTDMDADDTLSFDWKVSSETNYDKLGFYVNDSLYGSVISGATDWATITYTAPESGSFTFEWRYSKDVSVNSNDDCGYVDNVEHLPSSDTHTVRFLDWDGTVLKTETVEHGGTATAPADPSRTGYTFIGWDKAFNNVKRDLDVTAQYQINTYTVTFTGAYNGTQEVQFGGNAELPVLDAEGVHYTFTVDGEPWDGTNITEDVTVVVGMEIDVYTVTFIDPITETVLKTEQVMYGCGATAPEVPEHPGYTFIGWSRDFSFVASDMIVYAQYEINIYTVTFTGVYSGTQQVPYGGDAELPVLDAEGVHYTFTVDGEPWDGTNITSDVTVVVGMEIDVYTVTFIDPITDTVLKTEQVMYGCGATAPEAPEHYGYTFTGWSADYSAVTGDITVYALYDPVLFTVIFTDGLGNILSTQSVPYMSAAEPPETPQREGWEFDGWDADFSCIEQDTVVNALWERVYCTVTFTGVYIGTVSVEYGCDCELPVLASPGLHYTFTVDGEPWDGLCLTASVTVTVGVAINTYMVTFLDWDGSVLKTQTVTHGASATAPDDPERKGYVFVGWDASFAGVTGDLTVNAVYEAITATLLGDVDCDGEVTMADVSALAYYLLNSGAISSQGYANADVNGDGRVDVLDLPALCAMIV